MLSRVFHTKQRSPPARAGGEGSIRSCSHDYEELIFGFLDDDIPLISFEQYKDESSCDHGKVLGGGKKLSCNSVDSRPMTLRQVLRASVGVIGESPLGMTEKVAFMGGNMCAVKRFRRVSMNKSEFGRRMERVAELGKGCEYLVPVMAYLYTKRIKLVVCDYYPMGSLSDLLSRAREQGHKALEWKHRYKIIIGVAKAIEFIHSSHNPYSTRDGMQLNVHGSIKSSNVMIHLDFSPRLSGHGFVQLAEPVVVVDDTEQVLEPPDQERVCMEHILSQESDIYNFGVVLMDVLGWPNISCTKKLFEFYMDENEETQVWKAYDIALKCTNSLADARPNIEQILSCFQIE